MNTESLKTKSQKMLIIDDEVEITKSLVRQFKHKYTVFSATSAVDALKILESEDIQVIVSDQRMPGMTGIEFFSKIKIGYPDIVKLILTGYSDINNVIEAINKAQVFRYITKPWNPEELEWTINEAFAKYELQANNRELLLKLSDANIHLEEKVILRTNELEKQNLILEQSEERFQLLFNKAPLCYQSLNMNGCIIEVNQQWVDILGYERDDVKGKWFGDFLTPMYRDGFRERFPIFKAQGYIHSEFEMVHKNGSILFIAFDGKIGTDTDGNFIQTHCILQDITETKRVKEALLEAEWKFKALFELGPIGVAYHRMIYDEAGAPYDYFFIDANNSYNELTGINPKGMTVRQAFPGIENDPADWIGMFGRVAKTGETIRFEQFLESNQRWYDCVGYQYKPDHFVAAFNEITKRKQAEIALRESEEKYRILFEANKDGIAIFKPYPDGKVSNFLEMNESAAAMLGYTKAEFSAMNPADIEVDITDEKMNLRLNDLKTKGFSTFETSLRHKNGSIVPVEINVQVIKYNNLPALMNITRDISEHKKAENIIQQSREQFIDLYENAPIGYHEIDTEGKIMRMNKTELEMFGYMMEDVNGHCIWEFFHNKTISEAITKRKLGGVEISVLPYESEFKHKNGSLVTILVQDKVLRDTNGNITGIRSTVQDITQRKQTEQKLQESELFFRETQHVGGIGSYKLNFQTGYWNSSEVLDNIFGIDAEFERSVSGWVDIIFQEDKDMMNRYFAEEVVGKHQLFNKEYRIQRISDGEVRWVHGLGKLVFDENKQLLLMQGTIQDITDRNAKENLLLESERRFRELLSSVQLVSVILDMDGNITFCNEYLLNLTHYKHNEVIGKNWFEIFIHGNDVEEIRNIFKKSNLEGDLELYYENEILTKENEKRWIAWSNTALYDSTGKINGVASLGIDITEQRKAAESIRKSKDRLNRAEFASKSGNWEFYAENGIIKASKGAAKVYGLSEKEFNYENIKSILLPEYSEMMDVALKNLIEKNEPYNIEFKIKSVDTNEIKDIHSTAVYDIDRKVVFGVIQDITDKKRAEQALIESEKELRSLIEFSPVPIAIIQNSRVIYFNKTAINLFGANSSKDVLNKSMFDFIHPDYHDLARQNVLLIAENGYIPTHEEKYCKFDGNIIDVESQAKSIRFNGENATIVMINDITARKRAEKELRESEEKYRLISSVVSDYIFTSTIDKNRKLSLSWVAGAFEKITGYTFEEYLNAGGWRGTLHPDDLEKDNQDIAQLKKNTPVTTDIRTIAKDGKIVWVRVYAHPIWDESYNKLIGIYGGVKDISESIKAEISLRTSEDKFKKAFMINPESITITSFETGVFKEVNKGFCQIFGYDISEVIGRKSADLHIWYDISDRQFVVNELKIRGVVENYVTRFITKKGELIYGMVSATIIDLNGEKHILLITSDITKIKNAEQKLQESNNRLNLILESSPIAIWDWDIVNDIWFATPKYYTMLGYKPESGLPDRKIWLNRVHPDDRLMVSNKISNILNHSSNNYKYDARMLHADGSYRWQTVIGQVIEKDTDNNAVRMIGVRIDVHERMKAEETLKRSQKLLSDTEKIGKVGGWEFNMDTFEQIWTEETFNIHEVPYSFDATIEKGINFYTPESLPIIQHAVKQAVEHGKPFDLELEIITAKGNRKCVHTIGQTDIVNRRVFGFFQDITERKKAEEQINIQMDELRRWYKVTLDREGRVLELKREVNELLKMHGEALRYGNNIEESIDINKKE